MERLLVSHIHNNYLKEHKMSNILKKVKDTVNGFFVALAGPAKTAKPVKKKKKVVKKTTKKKSKK